MGIPSSGSKERVCFDHSMKLTPETGFCERSFVAIRQRMQNHGVENANMAVSAPMPRANARIAEMQKPGCLESERSA